MSRLFCYFSQRCVKLLIIHLSPHEGAKGKLRACYEGDDKWVTFDFSFLEIDEATHTLRWGGKVAGKASLRLMKTIPLVLMAFFPLIH